MQLLEPPCLYRYYMSCTIYIYYMSCNIYIECLKKSAYLEKKQRKDQDIGRAQRRTTTTLQRFCSYNCK